MSALFAAAAAFFGVLFFSGLSFAGYVARRLVGPGHGYLVTGLLGGVVSSTNVTFTFARTSRTDLVMDRPLAFGAVAAGYDSATLSAAIALYRAMDMTFWLPQAEAALAEVT